MRSAEETRFTTSFCCSGVILTGKGKALRFRAKRTRVETATSLSGPLSRYHLFTALHLPFQLADFIAQHGGSLELLRFHRSLKLFFEGSHPAFHLGLCGSG